MNYKWLKKTNSNKLIIFFNGWGMDDYIVSNLEPEDFDVVVLYDYNNLDLDINTESYTEKHIISWSMGVMISTLFNFGDIKSFTAISGTPYPIDNEYGIPTKIYNLTIKGFNETSVRKFMERMFITKPEISKFSDRTTESQKSELIKLLEYNAGENTKFTRVIIPDNDIIIPTKNQLNYWMGGKYRDRNIMEPEIIMSGHCPFGMYKKWAELL